MCTGEWRTPPEGWLVNEVSDFCQDAVIQFYACKPCSNLAAQTLFKSLKLVSGQVCLVLEEPQERLGIGLPIVIAGQTTCWPNG